VGIVDAEGAGGTCSAWCKRVVWGGGWAGAWGCCLRKTEEEDACQGELLAEGEPQLVDYKHG
jgi:hypothetical protein